MQNGRSDEYTIIINAIRITQHWHKHVQASVMEGHSIEEVVLAVDSATMESSDSEYHCHQQGARRSHTRCYLAKMSLFVTSVKLSGVNQGFKL